MGIKLFFRNFIKIQRVVSTVINIVQAAIIMNNAFNANLDLLGIQLHYNARIIAILLSTGRALLV